MYYIEKKGKQLIHYQQTKGEKKKSVEKKYYQNN